MTEHWVFSDQGTYLWEVIFSFPTYWKCFKASLENNSIKKKWFTQQRSTMNMKVRKPNDPLTTLFFECQDVFVMYDIKVYCRSLQQKLTQFDFLSGMTFGSFSIDHYRLWITRRQKNYFFAISNAGVMVQRSLSKIAQTIPNETCISFSQLAGQIQLWKTLKNPLKTGKENVNNTTNTNIVSFGQDSIYHFLPSFLN